MNYHNIIHDDMRNGPGLRVTLFVSGCPHRCKGCHNPQTWDMNSGIPFDESAKQEIFEYLDKRYTQGITISGGDPLYGSNAPKVSRLIKDIRNRYSDKKDIMVYTGYTFHDDLLYAFTYPEVEIYRGVEAGEDLYPRVKWVKSVNEILANIDILVDGKFDERRADVNYKWAGSTNQKIINMNELKHLWNPVTEERCIIDGELLKKLDEEGY